MYEYSDDHIRAVRARAILDGRAATIHLCDRALEGDAVARRECDKLIAYLVKVSSFAAREALRDRTFPDAFLDRLAAGDFTAQLYCYRITLQRLRRAR